MGVFKDLTGEKINNWHILSFKGISKFGASTWECMCDCENKTIKTMSLQSIKKTNDCGCHNNKKLIGSKVGKLTVLEKDLKNTKGRNAWVCRCDCGEIITVIETLLINNKTYSCGCMTRYKEGVIRESLNECIFEGDTVKMFIGENKYCIIDEEDYDIVKFDKWTISSDRYAVSSSGKFKWKRMHRVLINCEQHQVVDHINRDRLDNRKSNLRIATSQQNSFNQSMRYDNKSGVIGVCWWDRDGKWMAQIKVNYKRKYLGYFSDIEDAIIARLNAEKTYFGEEYAPQRHLFDEYGIN